MIREKQGCRRGPESSHEAWRGFFTSFPDYQNSFDRLEVDGDRVAVVGRSRCSDLRLDGPALWAAKVRGGKLAEWRVYEDTPTNRHTLGVSHR